MVVVVMMLCVYERERERNVLGQSWETHIFSKYIKKNSSVDSNIPPFLPPNFLITSLIKFRDYGRLSKKVLFGLD